MIYSLQRDNGKTYAAVYQWSKKGTEEADEMKKPMLKLSV
jgi:hypothetical protein